MTRLDVPAKLQQNLQATERGREWLEALPAVIESLAQRWRLSLFDPFSEELSGSWVAPCDCRHGPAVLKVAFPHFEADYEIDGLLAWNGGCTVRLLEADESRRALLLERCEPGTFLRLRRPEEQDSVIAELCRELWRTPAPNHVRSLTDMIDRWCNGARRRYDELRRSDEGIDFALAGRGLAELGRLARERVSPRLLATDLHAGNVLASTRRPWLVIDPKPHVGDAAYDLTQHLMNVKSRIAEEGIELIGRLAELAGVDEQRLVRWTFGRLCMNPKDLPLARKLTAHL